MKENTDVLSTIQGKEIPVETRAILYLCQYDRKNNKIHVVNEMLFEDTFQCLTAYSNIPNPESQMVEGKTFDELIINLQRLHKNLSDPNWVQELSNYI